MKKKPALPAPLRRSATIVPQDATAAIAMLRSHATSATLAGYARYGIPSEGALGVPMNKIQLVAKSLGRDHVLAEALWASGIYEARLLAAYVGDPAQVTPPQMERWCSDFDNWAVVDTVCFVLFDRSPQAWAKVRPWAKKAGEFQRRAGYVLLACLAAHAKEAEDGDFLPLLPLIEDGAADERNFVKKGVSWALRMVGRRSAGLNTAALAVATRLAAADHPAERWIGRGAVKELSSPAVKKRLGAKK